MQLRAGTLQPDLGVLTMLLAEMEPDFYTFTSSGSGLPMLYTLKPMARSLA
jgi:hypothetical protein